MHGTHHRYSQTCPPNYTFLWNYYRSTSFTRQPHRAGTTGVCGRHSYVETMRLYRESLPFVPLLDPELYRKCRDNNTRPVQSSTHQAAQIEPAQRHEFNLGLPKVVGTGSGWFLGSILPKGSRTPSGRGEIPVLNPDFAMRSVRFGKIMI